MRKFVFTIILLLVFIYPVETVQASCTAREMNDPKNVCFYRTDYKTMSKSLTLPNQIQLFSGDIVSAEFDESPDPSTGVNRYYPGHLGSFWAPPYYSSHENYSWSGSNPADQQRSFYTSLVYYNRDYHGGAWEKPVDLETEAFWYPSKTEFTSFFPGGGGGTQIRSVKMALPQRSLALKITETSKTPNTNNPNLLFIIGVDTISKLDHWDRFTESGWNWGAKKSYLSENSETVRAKYLSSDKIVIFYNPANSSYVAVGLDNSASSKNLHWELADNLNPNPQIGFHNRFKNTGILGDVNNETEKGGAVAGLSFEIPGLSINQSYTATLFTAIGGSETEVTTRIHELRNVEDIEAYADKMWNSRLVSMLNNFPVIETSNNEVIKRQYYYSALSYLLNRWDNFGTIGTASFYGLSTGFFPWMTGTTKAFALSDPPFWKEMLKKLLTMDYKQCQTYQPLNHNSVTDNLDRCTGGYSYSVYSLVEAIYDYVAFTNERDFLGETVNGKQVIEWVQELALYKESGNEGKLVDFGNDSNLYEFNIHCSSGLAGRYTGYVVSPNSERFQALSYTSEMLGYYGNEVRSREFAEKAKAVKSAIQGLWDTEASWFKTISLWGEDLQKREYPVVETFPAVAVFHSLDAANLLSNSQRASLINKINSSEWINPQTLRFTSLPQSLKQQWCVRTDWHGPGLYSGEIGTMLSRMFTNGLKNKAAEILYATPGKGYYYLSKIPIAHQAYAVDDETFLGGQNSAYYEGISLAQTIIDSLAGVDPTIGLMRFRPRLPDNLGYPFGLRNINIAGYQVDFTSLSKSQTELSFSPKSRLAQPLKFQYSPDEEGHMLTLRVNNSAPGKRFIVSLINSDNGQRRTQFVNSDNSGSIYLELNILSDSTVSVEPFSALPGDLNQDGKVNIDDFIQFISNFTNIYDFNTLISNFGKTQ